MRALETARLACDPLAVEVEVTAQLRGGDFDPGRVAGDAGNVLLVGHEPDFSRAVATTTGARIEFRKGGLAAIEDGRLVALLRPAALRRIARI